MTKEERCEQFRRWAVEASAGMADPSERGEWEAHRRECVRCDAYADEMNGLAGTLRTVAALEGAPRFASREWEQVVLGRAVGRSKRRSRLATAALGAVWVAALLLRLPFWDVPQEVSATVQAPARQMWAALRELREPQAAVVREAAAPGPRSDLRSEVEVL